MRLTSSIVPRPIGWHRDLKHDSASDLVISLGCNDIVRVFQMESRASESSISSPTKSGFSSRNLDVVESQPRRFRPGGLISPAAMIVATLVTTPTLAPTTLSI
jgi:hypothetical protein